LLRNIVNSELLSQDKAEEVACRVSKITPGFTGADLAGVVRSASSFALARLEDKQDFNEAEYDEYETDTLSMLDINLEDFRRAVQEVGRDKGGVLQRLTGRVREWIGERFSKS
jgi:SpoVK/Ycf46/Vps4 family AAA+-type ATPase